MANQSNQGQGQGKGAGQMDNDYGKSAGKKPFGSGGSEEKKHGLEEGENPQPGYDIDTDGPTQKDAGGGSWRDRPDSDTNKPRK